MSGRPVRPDEEADKGRADGDRRADLPGAGGLATRRRAPRFLKRA